MKTFNRKFVSLVIGLSLIFAQVIAETAKVRFAYLPVIHALPLYVAIDKGYFKEAGIDVEPIKFQVPNQIIDGLLAGNIDIASSAATGITAITQYKNPGTLKIFSLTGSALPNRIDHAFLVKTGSKISSLKDLKGKKLGTIPSIQWRTISRYILMKAGLNPDTDLQIILLELPLQLPALMSGQVDAILTLEPIVTIGKAQNNVKVMMSGPGAKYIANPFYAGCGVVSTQFASKNPATTAKILSIYKRAVDEINRNPNAYRRYLKGYTPLNDETAKKVSLPIFKFYSDFKPSDVKTVQAFADIFTEQHVIDGKIDVRQILYH